MGIGGKEKKKLNFTQVKGLDYQKLKQRFITRKTNRKQYSTKEEGRERKKKEEKTERWLCCEPTALIA